MKEELREYARARCAEQLRKQRTYELPGHLRGEPVAVNATVGGDKFDASELRHLNPAPNGLFPRFDVSDKMTWLTPRQVRSPANQAKIYECQVYAVHGPAFADMSDQAAQRGAHFDAAGRLAKSQHDRDGAASLGVVDMDRQKAALVVVRIEQRELLMAVRDIAGVVNIENDAGRRAFVRRIH